MQVGRIGDSDVERTSRFFRRGAYSTGGGTATAPGNYIGQGAGPQSAVGGRGGARSSGFSGGGNTGGFLAGRGALRFARPYGGPEMTGRHLFTTLGGPLPIPPTRKNALLLRRMGLTSELGNTGPARRARTGRQIRDALSQQSLDNGPAPEAALERPQDRRSYSDVLALQIAAKHARAMEEGWELFHTGKYREATRRFESAESSDPDDAEAAIGIIWSAVADHSRQLAYAVLARAVARGDGVFNVDLDMKSKYASPQSMSLILAAVSREARQNPDSVELATMSAFLNWFAGQRNEALRIADRIHEEHRTTAYASMAAQMRGETVLRQRDVFKDGGPGFSPFASKPGRTVPGRHRR